MCLWRAELLTGLLLRFRLLAIPISAYSPHSSVPICHCPFPNSPQNRHLLSSQNAPVRISGKTLDFWKAEPVLTTYICRHTKLAHRQKCWMKSLLFILFLFFLFSFICIKGTYYVFFPQPHIFNWLTFAWLTYKYLSWGAALAQYDAVISCTISGISTLIDAQWQPVEIGLKLSIQSSMKPETLAVFHMSNIVTA